MRANDIRLGNTLNYLDKHQSLKRGFVTHITSGKVVFDHKDSVKTENIMPIPINHQELLGLGFNLEREETFFHTYFTKDRFGIVFCVRDDEIFKEGHCYAGEWEWDMWHVHDIQNLYYMRTKKELINKYFG